MFYILNFTFLSDPIKNLRCTRGNVGSEKNAYFIYIKFHFFIGPKLKTYVALEAMLGPIKMLILYIKFHFFIGPKLKTYVALETMLGPIKM